MKEAWQVLGVEPCSGKELEKAYRKAKRKAHPDTGGSHEAFIAVQEAYKTITESNEPEAVVTVLYQEGSLFNVKERIA